MTEEAAVIISGGTDSTLIAAYIKELDNQRYRNDKKIREAFTMKLEHQPEEELDFAKSLCKQWRWNHHVFHIDERHMVNSYLQMLKILDEPNGDRSLIPTHLLAQIISPHSRIAIGGDGGDGGDELFCGSDRYRTFEKIFNDHKNIDWADLYWEKGLNVGDNITIKSINKKLGLKEGEMNKRLSTILQSQWKHSPGNFLRALDLNYYLPIVLDKVDKASMFYGLEVRSPLLDTKLAMAALAIEPNIHMKDGTTKSILKQILEEKVGKIPKLRTKQGFGALIKTGGIFEKFLKERIERYLNESKRHTTSQAQWIYK
ncbi:asparagine synthase C-terminal domain-containing protein [Synechococcus sp. AH-551-A10]|nr:asparagine synthase C-terminal domain-containing protein [Synechococcus sp. AH-551-A10]MDB4682072.1 asparagine synthase C-terminal domain-containing protein [Synechococcus sp. AH-551-A10]